MDSTTIISMAVFIFTNIGTIIAMFLWLRTESNADRREFNASLLEFRSETNSLITAIREDIKDFHGRLCAIEERNKK